MRAAVLHAFGGPEQLSIEEAPDPVAGPRDVLVQVHATSVNPIDFKVRKGYQRGAVWRRPPMILGMDVSGVVVATGARVTRFRVGDEVISSPSHMRPGTNAELVAIDEKECARKPTSISHLEAATLPLVGLTAWGCLVDGAKMKAGESLLIQAGSGGVGTFAIQLAATGGVHVATTCSGRNAEFVTSLGAETVIDYTKDKFEEVLPPQDAILECMGGDIAKRSMDVLKPGGRFASINVGLDARAQRMNPYLAFGVTIVATAGFVIGTFIKSGTKVYPVVRKADGPGRLTRISEMVDAGQIRAVIDRTFPLSEIADAHRYCETGRVRGKVAIEVRQ
ncbi:MAG: NADP-dependent oxidoreductase [Proteobacteria bacterium]|nr:NADP-dependent oxidoreductase [Pseudomonadota bacterium]